MYKGGFTLPGEAGYEKLTLKMAEKWGADVIRDSDGTTLSPEILDAGYGIYSTICIIRDHNEWARENPDALQQTFLMSKPVVATEDGMLAISLLDGYEKQQFCINDSSESISYWQVFDRTTNEEIDFSKCLYDAISGTVSIPDVKAYHSYTVNFLSYRIWEEISMYNHITNSWNKEHLVPIDPRMQKAQDYLLKWMDQWCVNHPATSVVRFTSMFYNFVWIWGEDERHRNYFTDWGSYDFTVSTTALKQFEEQRGYRLTSEDFIHQGKLNSNNMPPSTKMLDYIDFTNKFVTSFGKKLIDVVHSYGKQAYMFYDDSWVGTEPYSNRFEQFGFDGLIKCVFNGYEVRQCANVSVDVHEIRLHPYLFPTGLNGTPTFMPGGDPTTPAKEYWAAVRRAILRQPVDRIGLGGYLHLVQDFPEFCDYIEHLSDEFRDIKRMHQNGGPYTLPIHVGVLSAWGKLRTWSLSGNYRETCMHDLLHVLEALSGLPVKVSFFSFEDLENSDDLNGALADVDVLINAGDAGTAWSGGEHWTSEKVVTKLTKWVHDGGTFMGVGEPSAVDGYYHYFRMAEVLGLDENTGAYTNHGKWSFNIESITGYESLIPEGAELKPLAERYLLNGEVKVLAAGADPDAHVDDYWPSLTVHGFGSGKGIYLSQFHSSNGNNRLLMNLLLFAKGMNLDQKYFTDNPQTECAYYPEDKTLVVVNNSIEPQVTHVRIVDVNDGDSGIVLQDVCWIKLQLDAYETKIVNL